MRKTGMILIGAALLFSSCEEVQQFTQTPSAVVAPKFTTIDKLIQLTPGMTFSEVVTTLGCEPYDVFTINDAEDKTVLIWHYKKFKRSENPFVLDSRAGATTGNEVMCCMEIVYVTFENQKFVKLITDAGKLNNAVPAQNSNSDQNQAPSLFKLK